MQREILQTDRTPDLRVYAVWVPFLGGNEQAAGIARQVLPDPRVVQYWDGGALTSRWFAENVDHSPGLAWDVYYLYGPEATWAKMPEPLLSSGGSIIGQSSGLDAAISPLLARASRSP